MIDSKSPDTPFNALTNKSLPTKTLNLESKTFPSLLLIVTTYDCSSRVRFSHEYTGLSGCGPSPVFIAATFKPELLRLRQEDQNFNVNPQLKSE